MTYNFQYLIDVSKAEKSFEFNKIMNAVDNAVSGSKKSNLFHIVPVLYSFTFVSGMIVFLYKIIL